MEESNVNEFRIIDKLGEGSFADVYKVKSINDQKIYAEKRLKKRYRSLDEVRNLTEVSALKLLSRHPNIITLHSLMYDTQTGHVALIFEQMEMNLYDFLSKRKEPLDEYIALLLMYQLTKAIVYVHSCGIFHRDIKPENCLINSDITELKLADFGSVSPIANRTRFTEYVATRWYRAPECILTTGAYGPPVDIWAIGCVFYEVLTMRPLFPGKHQLDQLNKIHSVLGTPSRDFLAQFQNGQQSKVGFAFPQKSKQTFESLLPTTNPEVVDLIKKMITYDPSERISAQDVLRHPAFRNLFKLDIEWQKTSRQVPFSVFAIQGKEKIMIIEQQQQQQQQQEMKIEQQILLQQQQQSLLQQQQQTQQHQHQKETDIYISSHMSVNQHQISHNNSNLSNLSNGKQPAPLIGIKPAQRKAPAAAMAAQMNPLETRRLAAQRIVDYHKRQMIAKSKAPALGAGGGQASRVPENTKARPIIRLGATSSNLYQKPRPDMVQPRLPPISYKPLK